MGGERAVALADGRFVIVSPPQGEPRRRPTHGGRLPSAVGDKQGRELMATSVPILSVRRPRRATARVLDVGVWLDGFEERRPGVLGGWIEAAGTMVGLEICARWIGARGGRWSKRPGCRWSSGRYGLGWTSARTAFETIDGGMTWRSVDVPQPLKPPREVESRACGPIGCGTAAGWIRIGWGGETESDPGIALPPPPTRPRDR